jgi:hypothetical protein
MPKRVTPIATISATVGRSRMPPEALMPARPATTAAIGRMRGSVAAAGVQPVPVLTKAAPLDATILAAVSISASVRWCSSRMTFSRTGTTTSSTAAISSRT